MPSLQVLPTPRTRDAMYWHGVLGLLMLWHATLCHAQGPMAAGAPPERATRAGRFEQPELGVAMTLAPGSPYGLVGGALLMAPLPYLVIEAGIAQRLSERPHATGAVRYRFLRGRTLAGSLGLGLYWLRSHDDTYRFSCFMDEYECGRKARSVWGMPLQVTLEARLASNLTFAPHFGFTVPIAWESCREYREGEDRGRCVPLLRPYLGLTLSWSSSLTRASAQRGRP